MTIQLLDSHARDDLELFAIRAHRLDQQAVIKLEVYPGSLAAYCAPLYATSLDDMMPTVLGVRTFAISREAAQHQAVYLAADLLTRLAYLRKTEGLTLEAPVTEVSAVWLGVTPPRTGWQRWAGRIRGRDIQSINSEGVAHVSEAVKDSNGATGRVGQLAVAKIRSRVWAQQPEELRGMPAGVAFAAIGLGFAKSADDDGVPTIAVFRHHNWGRVSLPFGEVLAHSRFLPKLPAE